MLLRVLCPSKVCAAKGRRWWISALNKPPVVYLLNPSAVNLMVHLFYTPLILYLA